ncbi:MAG TPA: FecR domain-containing protein [Saprospiraceae bacterium]|nr:FecR domain-containing protein [Saprospiraceae bacterium]HMQ85371.1 FecR domain-containing protein [Saprospiraceae bacterium]
MEDAKYLDLIGRYLSGEADEREIQALLSWADEHQDHQLLLDDMTLLWQQTGDLKLDIPEVNPSKAWQNITEKLSGGSHTALVQEAIPEAKQVRLLSRRWLAYAAGIAVMITAAWALWSNASFVHPTAKMVEVRTVEGETKEVLLPDQSTVVLNENSLIQYAEDFEVRHLSLSGEAYFEIAKMDGKTFTIQAAGTTTTVLGTAFNIRAYDGEQDVRISVTHGEVAFQQEEKPTNEVRLKAGMAGAYKKVDERIVLAEEDPNAAAWNNQKLIFENTEMSKVIETLERYFKINLVVEAEELNYCHFSAKFEKPTLEKVFEALSFTMEINARSSAGVYYLDGDPSKCE